MSQKTGIAPTYSTAFTVATQVNEGKITSSHFLIPAANKARWSAVVQLDTAIE